jgi:hypothetical protein
MVSRPMLTLDAILHGAAYPIGFSGRCGDRDAADIATRNNPEIFMRTLRRLLPTASLLAVASGFVPLHMPRAEDGPRLSAGQAVYAAVYSQIQHGNLWRSERAPELPLSSMLSVRNTDTRQGFRLESVKYFDGEGKLLREFVPEPRVVGPMATLEFFIENRDMSGGSGAKFLVSWMADAPINAPIIETVHAFFFGTQSLAFVTPGRVIRTN